MTEYKTGAGQVKLYPFALTKRETLLAFKYWPDPWWLRLWFWLRANYSAGLLKK